MASIIYILLLYSLSSSKKFSVCVPVVIFYTVGMLPVAHFRLYKLDAV